MDLETLLRTDPPSQDRHRYTYYNKEQEIPVVGDIIRLERIGDYEDLLITEVVLGTRYTMYYRGYGLSTGGTWPRSRLANLTVSDLYCIQTTLHSSRHL